MSEHTAENMTTTDLITLLADARLYPDHMCVERFRELAIELERRDETAAHIARTWIFAQDPPAGCSLGIGRDCHIEDGEHGYIWVGIAGKPQHVKLLGCWYTSPETYDAIAPLLRSIQDARRACA